MHNIQVNIELTNKEFETFEKIKFHNDDINLAISNEDKLSEKILDSLIASGIVQYVVTSWGYEEHELHLTKLGKYIIKYIS